MNDEYRFPNSESRNPILLVSGNNYGQLTTSAKTDHFYLEFPFCQVGRLQWIHQPDIVSYNRECTIIGYRSSQAWWTVTTEKCVSSGIVSFTFCIRRLNRQNLFLGISLKSMSARGFLGENPYSWGLMASGSIWYKSKRQIFCDPLHENDVVKLTINFSEQSLSVTVNGKYKGVAFRNIPNKQSVMPGVSFFDAGDMVELVSYKVCATTYTRSDIEISYLSSESTKEESVQWLSRVPETRLQKARELEKMGFDIHVCVLGLEAANDDKEQAVDYILTNINELNRKTAHLINSQNKAEYEKIKEQKIKWFMSAFLEDEKKNSMRRLPWTCPYCSTGNNFTETVCVKCQRMKPDLESAAQLEKNKLRWGFRLHVLPDYSSDYLHQLTQESINSNSLQLPGINKWTIESDHDLVDLATEYCYLYNYDVLTVFPERLDPSDQLLMKYPRLIDFSKSQMQIRFYLLQQLNLKLKEVLPFINISCEDSYDLLHCLIT